MTGFKSGASDDDPFEDAEETTDESAAGSPDRQEANPDVDVSTDPERSGAGTRADSEPTNQGLPWLYSRSSITDGREKTVQLHLQRSTLQREEDALRDVPIEAAVQKADLREAAYLVGLSNLDDVAAQLREWGYDID